MTDFKQAFLALEKDINDLCQAAGICARMVHDFSNAERKVDGKPLDLDTWLELHEQTIEFAEFSAYLVSSLAEGLQTKFSDAIAVDRGMKGRAAKPDA